jgi:hypothetical protein
VDVLLRHGFSLFGEHVSIAEFVGQLCALAVVFLAQRRTRLVDQWERGKGQSRQMRRHPSAAQVNS